MIINGQVRDRDRATTDHHEIVRRTGELLAAVGEQLLPGHRLITGSIVQVPVQPGDRVIADLGVLGRAEIRIAATATPPSAGS